MLFTSYPIKSAHRQFKDLLDTKLHILLCGPPGIGKSTLIYGYKDLYKIIELNASNDRGIATVRNQIKDLTCHKQKLILMIDEADYMTIDAQSALRKLFELNTNTKLILTCNDKSKLISPLRSRMYEIKLESKFSFKTFQRDIFTSKCKRKENFESKNLAKIFWYFEGDKRAVLNFLQADGLLNFDKQYFLINEFMHEYNANAFLENFHRTGELEVFKRLFVFSSFNCFFGFKNKSEKEVQSVSDAFLFVKEEFKQIDNISFEFISLLCISDSIEEVMSNRSKLSV